MRVRCGRREKGVAQFDASSSRETEEFGTHVRLRRVVEGDIDSVSSDGPV